MIIIECSTGKVELGYVWVRLPVEMGDNTFCSVGKVDSSDGKVARSACKVELGYVDFR